MRTVSFSGISVVALLLLALVAQPLAAQVNDAQGRGKVENTPQVTSEQTDAKEAWIKAHPTEYATMNQGGVSTSTSIQENNPGQKEGNYPATFVPQPGEVGDPALRNAERVDPVPQQAPAGDDASKVSPPQTPSSPK
jgi:hypothetical protein